jgi:penicillin-binding protein 2
VAAAVNESSRLRVSIVGVVVIALFSALFVRLWFLQVGSGRSAAQQIVQNTVRTVAIDPLRGRILDDQGRVLADNRIVNAITMNRTVTAAQRKKYVALLASLLHTTVKKLNASIDDVRVSPVKPAIVAEDVPQDVSMYVSEHNDQMPGLNAEQLAVREYPHGQLGAQVVGWVGQITATELKARKKLGYDAGDIVGRAGVESSYETLLRGKPGHEDIEVDPAGKPVNIVKVVPATPGDDIKLAIDLDTEYAAEVALQQAITSDRLLQDKSNTAGFSTYPATQGSVLVMDADTGAVVASASNPSYNPDIVSNHLTDAIWASLNPKDPTAPQPMQNINVQHPYATGSTFKLFTAISALDAHDRYTGQVIDDTGKLRIGDRYFTNEGGGIANGPVDLAKALTVSSDVYFYGIGYDFWKQYQDKLNSMPKNTSPDAVTVGLQIQTTARAFGFGSVTGIALPGEQRGRVPDPKFRVALNKNGSALSRIWYPGDNVNFGVGQGDFLATPLQLANGYATYMNDGHRLVPRIATAALKAGDKTVDEAYPVISNATVSIDASYRAAIDQGLTGVVQSAHPKGTAYDAFQGFPFSQIPVRGKTGTAQVEKKSDTSVFVAMTTINGHNYVIVALIEQGGFGASVAAPVVRRVIENMAGLPYFFPVQAVPNASVN